MNTTKTTETTETTTAATALLLATCSVPTPFDTAEGAEIMANWAKAQNSKSNSDAAIQKREEANAALAALLDSVLAQALRIGYDLRETGPALAMSIPAPVQNAAPLRIAA